MIAHKVSESCRGSPPPAADRRHLVLDALAPGRHRRPWRWDVVADAAVNHWRRRARRRGRRGRRSAGLAVGALPALGGHSVSPAAAKAIAHPISLIHTPGGLQ